MKKHLLYFASVLFLAGFYPAAQVQAQTSTYIPVMPFVGLVNALAAQKAANNGIAAKTTTTVTYRGQTFQMKRTADSILTGSATDRIKQLETQLTYCYATLLADTLNATCPPERQATIRATLKYIDLARPNWDQKAYRDEFRFYLGEDKRRNRAIDRATN